MRKLLNLIKPIKRVESAEIEVVPIFKSLYDMYLSKEFDGLEKLIKNINDDPCLRIIASLSNKHDIINLQDIGDYYLEIDKSGLYIAFNTYPVLPIDTLGMAEYREETRNYEEVLNWVINKSIPKIQIKDLKKAVSEYIRLAPYEAGEYPKTTA